jgi:hypothetical protein
MKKRNSLACLLTALACFPTSMAATFDYKPLAMEPAVWEKSGISTELQTWEGNEVVFLAVPGDYDADFMKRWVETLDGGWKVYREIVGGSPRPHRRVGDKPSIAAVPDASFTCGAGCGYVGATGIELALFYHHDYKRLKDKPGFFCHYAFYEMGRNYYIFGDRHSQFITGYAVFMRYVCMDRLNCQDLEPELRSEIEAAESKVQDSGLGFLDTFTATEAYGEKRPRLKDPNGQALTSDQPVMYASAMLRLRKDQGGDEWTQRFFQHLHKSPRLHKNSDQSALKQCWTWYICASLAAGKDLSERFVDDWKLPMNDAQRKAAQDLDWKNPDLTPGMVLERLFERS